MCLITVYYRHYLPVVLPCLSDDPCRLARLLYDFGARARFLVFCSSNTAKSSCPIWPFREASRLCELLKHKYRVLWLFPSSKSRSSRRATSLSVFQLLQGPPGWSKDDRCYDTRNQNLWPNTSKMTPLGRKPPTSHLGAARDALSAYTVLPSVVAFSRSQPLLPPSCGSHCQDMYPLTRSHLISTEAFDVYGPKHPYCIRGEELYSLYWW